MVEDVLGVVARTVKFDNAIALCRPEIQTADVLVKSGVEGVFDYQIAKILVDLERNHRIDFAGLECRSGNWRGVILAIDVIIIIIINGIHNRLGKAEYIHGDVADAVAVEIIGGSIHAHRQYKRIADVALLV